jgi:hypothetical protein
MSYNWLDWAALGFVATVAGVQLMRAARDFSRVLYETLFLIGALVLTNRFFKTVHELTSLSYALSYLVLFAVAAAVAVVLAALLDLRVGFGMGAFSYVFGLLLAVVCAYVVGHAAIRVPYIAFAHKDRRFFEAVERSLVARDLLRFRTLVEVRALLRQARWLNI